MIPAYFNNPINSQITEVKKKVMLYLRFQNNAISNEIISQVKVRSKTGGSVKYAREAMTVH